MPSPKKSARKPRARSAPLDNTRRAELSRLRAASRAQKNVAKLSRQLRKQINIADTALLDLVDFIHDLNRKTAGPEPRGERVENSPGLM
jgi:hypothetical protein